MMMMKCNENSLSFTAQNPRFMFKVQAKTEWKCTVSDKSCYLTDSLQNYLYNKHTPCNV